jgi:hypothetical protein
VVVALVYAAAFAAARVVDLALPGVLGAAVAVAVGCVAAVPVALLPGGVTPTERRSALGRLFRR